MPEMALWCTFVHDVGKDLKRASSIAPRMATPARPRGRRSGSSSDRGADADHGPPAATHALPAGGQPRPPGRRHGRWRGRPRAGVRLGDRSSVDQPPNHDPYDLEPTGDRRASQQRRRHRGTSRVGHHDRHRKRFVRGRPDWVWEWDGGPERFVDSHAGGELGQSCQPACLWGIAVERLAAANARRRIGFRHIGSPHIGSPHIGFGHIGFGQQLEPDAWNVRRFWFGLGVGRQLQQHDDR
jgi:hypothetical protein